MAIDFLSQNTCFVPSRVSDNPGIVYSLLTKDLYFRFIFSRQSFAAEKCPISCIGAGPGLIFLNDASDKSWEPCAGIMEISMPKGSLATERS